LNDTSAARQRYTETIQKRHKHIRYKKAIKSI